MGAAELVKIKVANLIGEHERHRLSMRFCCDSAKDRCLWLRCCRRTDFLTDYRDGMLVD